MTEIVNVKDIVEENGKTVEENNLDIQHNIPIGSLVEVKYDEWGGNGSCIKVHARLWVVEHTRDCDGEPLYSLCKYPLHNMKADSEHILYLNDPDLRDKEVVLKNDISVNIIYGVVSGIAEKELTIIKITQDIKDGVGSLSWG